MRALVLIGLLACSRGASTPEPIANQGSAAPVTADAAPADASACVADCVHRNQMRAVEPELLAAECRAEGGE
jgi:hypothetical protein